MEIFTMMFIHVGIKELSRSIGSWAMPKDTKELEDNQTIR